jgi:hypothetical protein
MEMKPQDKAVSPSQAAHIVVLVASFGFFVILCSGVAAARSLGTVTLSPNSNYPRPAPCLFNTLTADQSDAFYDTNHATNTECYALVVSGCPLTALGESGTVANMTAFVAVTTPAGTPKGTIVLLSGDGGTSFFNFPSGGLNGLQGESYTSDYYNNGYITVQVAWASTWWDNTDEPPIKSILDEACRPASLLNYINAHYAYPLAPVCAQGHSAGAAAIGYSMAWYGADKGSGGYLQTALLTSGPALSDIQSGCAYTSPINSPPPQTVCGGGKCFGGAATQSWQDCLEYPEGGKSDCFSSPLSYPNLGLYDSAQSVSNKTISHTNLYYGEDNCNNYSGSGQTTTDLNAEWASMNLIAPGANFTYSHTFVYGYLCSGRDINPQNEDISNNTAAQGWSYQSLLTTSSQQPQNGFPTIYRIDGCTDPEMIWGPNSHAVGTVFTGFQQSESDMKTYCTVPH